MAAWKAVMALSLSTFILLFVIEGVLRVYDVVTGRIVSEDLVSKLRTHPATAHPFLEYTAMRSFSGDIPFIEPYQVFHVQTNAFGFRTHEFYPKTGNEFRVVLLGDSFTYGFNANQNETYGAVLEQLLRQRIARNIRVYSLGVPSYSGVRYAVLARLFFDWLQPDIVIVALDGSDFKEDVERISSYVLDENGAPIVLKNTEALLEREEFRYRIDEDGHLLSQKTEMPSWWLRLQFGSSLIRHSAQVLALARRKQFELRFAGINRSASRGEIPMVTYDQLVAKYGPDDLSPGLPEGLLNDTIPYSLRRALDVYKPTITSLRYIKTQTERRGATLLLSTYPYPWFVSAAQSLPYQVATFGQIFDLRKDRTQPQLVCTFAETLEVKCLDAFPLFEKEAAGAYGSLDPHFNARGYALYAEFLFNGIEAEVSRQLHR